MVLVEMFFDVKKAPELTETGYDFRIPAIILEELQLSGFIEVRPRDNGNLLGRDAELSRLILTTTRDRTFYDGVIRIQADRSLGNQSAMAVDECRMRIIRRIKKEVPPLRRANVVVGLHLSP